MTSYTFKDIPPQFVDIIFAGLGELPLKISGPVFTLLQQQKLAEEAKAQEKT